VRDRLRIASLGDPRAVLIGGSAHWNRDHLDPLLGNAASRFGAETWNAVFARPSFTWQKNRTPRQSDSIVGTWQRRIFRWLR